MARSADGKIRASRKILENPYAHIDGEGGYDAIYLQGSLDVHESRRLSGNPYAYLDVNGGYGEYKQADHSAHEVPQTLRSENLLGSKQKGSSFSKREIEDIVRKLHIGMWKDRAAIWGEKRSITPNDVLDPAVALRLVGYNMNISESLGQYSQGQEIFEVAGIIDDSERSVHVSRRFSPEIQKFTTAHELAHAILHQANGLHRDRAQDGGTGGMSRDEVEFEADIFAAYFLMPKKLVKAVFKKHFLTDHFTINEDTTFAFGYESAFLFEKKNRTLRDLAKLLAGIDQYNGQFFPSLAHQFGVSIEAMAIRLEELNLVSR